MHLDRTGFKKIAQHIVLATATVCSVLTFIFWGSMQAVLIIWVLTIPFAILLAALVNAVLRLFNTTMEIKDSSDEWVHGVEIECSVSTVGIYKDQAIYEWIYVKHPLHIGQFIKLHWEAAIDPLAFVPPVDKHWAIIMPGLLYTVPKENISS